MCLMTQGQFQENFDETESVEIRHTQHLTLIMCHETGGTSSLSNEWTRIKSWGHTMVQPGV